MRAAPPAAPFTQRLPPRVPTVHPSARSSAPVLVLRYCGSLQAQHCAGSSLPAQYAPWPAQVVPLGSAKHGQPAPVDCPQFVDSRVTQVPGITLPQLVAVPL